MGRRRDRDVEHHRKNVGSRIGDAALAENLHIERAARRRGEQRSDNAIDQRITRIENSRRREWVVFAARSKTRDGTNAGGNPNDARGADDGRGNTKPQEPSNVWRAAVEHLRSKCWRDIALCDELREALVLSVGDVVGFVDEHDRNVVAH
ncbi:unannotated protein [freshwater metagenome]|uniref:Unannotated protein n=1 Tax=freshwater metagenome TaxID=449393 RepID=A0A6J6NXB9_9ZZZZ